MATEAQISANRQNAEKSTGPRTDEGKAVVSQNAVKHGLFAIKTVVEGENQALFDLRREAMLGEMRPVGAMEVKWLFLIPCSKINSRTSLSRILMNFPLLYSSLLYNGNAPFSFARRTEAR